MGKADGIEHISCFKAEVLVFPVCKPPMHHLLFLLLLTMIFMKKSLVEFLDYDFMV